MATIGALFAVLFVYFRIEKVNISFKHFLLYLFSSVIFGCLGAKLLFVIAMLPQVDISASNLIYYFINGGIVFYGGMFGVLFGIRVMSKIYGDVYIDVINMMVPAIPLFHFWARIGCLLAGCCYGIPYKWGVVMQDELNVVRFPVQLFESILNLIIFVILILKEKKKKNYVNNLKIYLLIYSLGRFMLEFYRGDTIRGIFLGGLSTAQIISVLIWLYYILLLLRGKYNRKEG